METGKLRKFASFARSALIEQVGTRLKIVLAEKSLARRESPKVVEELEKRITYLGEKRVLEMVAYTWFNRFCALRYMDVNRYTRIGVISPADGQFQPEILAEAKMGHIDEELVPDATRKQVKRLLNGSDKSEDPQGEAYRLLLVAVCNYYHSLMPFMFERIADYTELLLPDDLLSGTSIPAYTREALLPINCSPEHTEESVEVIGWLYQFYIADKKDEVFEGLKKGKKITAENIPAATQLFTPHWIVRYLVENSLGRLWMLNHPESKLVERMDYYIKPEEPESDFLKIGSPEEIKVCDPACGSGHMLTYAFDLLYEIYREEQYPEPEIPTLILKNNLYGIEIDQRAGALAAFALTMKAREKDKRFFTRKAQPEASARDAASIRNQKSRIPNPHVCVLENINIHPQDLSDYMDAVGQDLFTSGLEQVLNQFKEVDNFGSLVRPAVTDVSEVLAILRERNMDLELLLVPIHQQVLRALAQADYLAPQYHVVVANPPYMGSRGMNAQLKQYANTNFPDSRSDLFAMFVDRNIELALPQCFVAMITMQSWMFLSSLEDLRATILTKVLIQTMAHLGAGAFDTIGGEVVSTTAFTLVKRADENREGVYIRLIDGSNEAEKITYLLEAISDPDSIRRFRDSASQLRRIPHSPIAYWATEAIRAAFETGKPLDEIAPVRVGLQTGSNETFVREWFEVSIGKTSFPVHGEHDFSRKWFPYNKGGEYRKWYGNHEHVVNWENDGWAIKNFADDNGKLRSRPQNCDYYFRDSISWSFVSSSRFGVRYSDAKAAFDVGGSSAFPTSKKAMQLTGFLCSTLSHRFMEVMNPTLNFQVGNVAEIPVLPAVLETTDDIAKELVELHRDDWNRVENTWGFESFSLLVFGSSTKRLSEAVISQFADWRSRVDRACELEQINNEMILAAYGAHGEKDTSFTRGSVTLSCNPAFRYGSGKSETELDDLLRADTLREFISYAVGCMLGRYSLDKPGLILANQGETVDEYRQQIPEPTFAPDEDNVIPILDGDWFDDEISQRFKEFLKVTFGYEHYDENLEFLENALYPDNPLAKKRKTIRDYFLKEFYDHHLKLYKKRPIYWLFSSPKGTFNALIYMHRYRPETVGKVLECLRDFREKLAHHAEQRQGVADSASESKAEKTKAVKDVAAIKKQLKELEEYEKTLFEVAAKKHPIDLDEGVKHNYLLFGPILRKIPGLAAKGD